MKSFILSLLLACLMTLRIGAQNSDLKGWVMTAEHVAAIDSVELFLEPGGHHGFTQANGQFLFSALPHGKYTLICKHKEFKLHKENINLEKNRELYIFLDSNTVSLHEVVIQAQKVNDFGIYKLNNVEGTSIYAGKKSEVIQVGDLNANLATNNARQVFSKVAGLNIFENDCAGIQLGIGGRGLNPNRISNFNTRQNGYDISADALGYPESYYTPPSEAIERIEIIRGAASLQYGTQFGGFINFKFKQPESAKKISYCGRQTMGSFGLMNSFNSVSGTIKKWSYYSFYQYKKGKGWRPNSGFELHTAHSAVNFKPNDKWVFTGEYTYMTYLAQQPGGLTDKQFTDDPTASYRHRNWFAVNWNLAAFKIKWEPRENTCFSMVNFGLLAGRDALGYQGSINRADPLGERTLLSDQYQNFGSEIKMLHHYQIKARPAVFLIGTRIYKGLTLRKQGLGDSDSLPHFQFLHPNEPEHSQYLFPSWNNAYFTENIIYISDKWSITPGMRYERIRTGSSGYYKEENKNMAGEIIYSATLQDERESFRDFLLTGLGTQYKYNASQEFYANISQNYRSINFNDMRVVNPNFKVDPQLKDEKGFTVDAGYRYSKSQFIYADISLFYLNYQNRIGTILETDPVMYTIYRYRTNISDSRNLGVECFFEIDLIHLFNEHSEHKWSVFQNLSFIDARYVSSKQSAYSNKKVEMVPPCIWRSGMSYKYKQLSMTLQTAYTAEQFSDATNSTYSANAISGLIPAYWVSDCSLSYKYRFLQISTGINNLSNASYFTRRADGYPGPGILPSDPINGYLTLQFTW